MLNMWNLFCYLFKSVAWFVCIELFYRIEVLSQTDTVRTLHFIYSSMHWIQVINLGFCNSSLFSPFDSKAFHFSTLTDILDAWGMTIIEGNCHGD